MEYLFDRAGGGSGSRLQDISPSPSPETIQTMSTSRVGTRLRTLLLDRFGAARRARSIFGRSRRRAERTIRCGIQKPRRQVDRVVRNRVIPVALQYP